VRLSLIFFFILLLSAFSHGQREPATGKTYPVMRLYNLGRVGYDLASTDDISYDTTYIPYWIEEYTESEISTNKLASLYPEMGIEKAEISFIPPDISEAVDGFIVMWYLRNEDPSKGGIVNVMILTLNTDSLIYYHLDINNNRDFTDDGLPFTFPDKQRDKLITIIDSNSVYEFTVFNISYKETGYYSMKPVEKDFIWKFNDTKPALFLSFSLSTGQGHPVMSYSPVQPSDTISIEYPCAVHSSFNFEGLIGVSFYRFNLSLLLAYEKEETGEKFEYVYLVESNPYEAEKISRANTGIWPEYKFYYGGTLAYEIPVFRPFRLSPSIGIGTWVYLKDHSFLKRDEYEDRFIDEYFMDRIYYNFGLDLKYLLSKSSTLFIHSGYKIIKYDASEYFLDVEPNSFEQQHNLWYIGAGVSFRIN